MAVSEGASGEMLHAHEIGRAMIRPMDALCQTVKLCPIATTQPQMNIDKWPKLDLIQNLYRQIVDKFEKAGYTNNHQLIGRPFLFLCGPLYPSSHINDAMQHRFRGLLMKPDRRH